MARTIVVDLSTELRNARVAAGLSQSGLARAAGVTQSRISRTERGVSGAVRIDALSQQAAALGLRVSLRLYPEGTPVRDAGQLRLVDRLRPHLHQSLGWRAEEPVAGTGDLRAWDLMVHSGAGWRVGVDAETRLSDIQATQRRCELKWRDSRVDRMILLVAETRHNRLVLREHRDALSSTFPADTAEVLRALRGGHLPERNGIVVV